MLGRCVLCFSKPVEVRHINLYVFGSEGLWICHACEMALVEFARTMIRAAYDRKLQAIKQQRVAEPSPEAVRAEPGAA